MLKLFNHYVPSTTIHQLVFDALLLFVAVVVAFVLQVRLDGALVASVVPFGILLCADDDDPQRRSRALSPG